MSLYKTCSIEQVIAQIYREFKPANSGWVDDAAEFIADAIGIMKVCQGFIQTSKEVNVIDFRAKLPCNIEVLLGIKYKGKRLQRNGGINHDDSKCTDLRNLLICVEESYILNPNYVQPTFQSGCITVYYYGLETDCNGLPTIIDDAIYRKAIVWYVMQMLCLRGFKHPVIDYQFCEKQWEKFYPQARNRFIMADIDDYEEFKKSWLGLVKSTNLTNSFFNTVERNDNGANSNAFVPGDLVQTFPILGKNQNNP